MAGKSKYCLEIEDFIAENSANGFSKRLIAQALGIPEKTVYSWFERKKTLRVKIAELRLQEAARRIKGVPDTFWLSKVMPEEFGDKPLENKEITVNMLVEVRNKLNETPGLEDIEEPNGS